MKKKMTRIKKRRFGRPKTNAQRRAAHKSKYGNSKLPPRGSGLRRK